MELYIKGKIARKGMRVETFRGEPAILREWYEPGTHSGGSGGRVYIELEGGSEGLYFQSIIGGEFREEAL